MLLIGIAFIVFAVLATLPPLGVVTAALVTGVGFIVIGLLRGERG